MDFVAVKIDDLKSCVKIFRNSDSTFVCCSQVLSLIHNCQSKGSKRLNDLRRNHDLSRVLVEKDKVLYVNKEGLNLIFSLIRSPKAKEFLLKHRDSLMLQLFGDGRLTEENVNMVDNLGRFDSISRMFEGREPGNEVQSGVEDRDEPRDDHWNDHRMETDISPVTEDSGDYGTQLYIRIALPSSFSLNSVATEGKLLTTDIVKFGITKQPNIRNGEYVRNGHDNGYFAFTFYTSSRESATLTESIMRKKLRNFTVYNSFEYIDVKKLATFLGLETGDGYDYYFYVAQSLFVYMMKVFKLIFEDDDHYGIRYTPSLADNGLCAAGGSNEVVQRLNVVYKMHPLRREDAVRMNVYDSSGRVQDLHQPITAPRTFFEVETVVGESSTNDEMIIDGNQVIAYNIITGEEKVFDNAEEAKTHFGISSMKTLLSQRTHFLGWVFHRPQNQRWQPPKGFMFRDLTNERKKKIPNLSYVKCINQNDGSIQYFENKAEAVSILAYKHHMRYLSGFVDKDVVDAYGRKWFSCEPSSVGEMVARDTPFLSTTVTKKVDNRTRGRVVAQNIETGEKREFGSSTAAADFFKMNRVVMLNDIVNKQRQAFGHKFRFIDAEKEWIPPPYFKYEKDSYETKIQKDFIVQKDRNGAILGLYESQKAASKILGIPRMRIGDHIQAHRIDEDGNTFHFATPEECGEWVEIQPEAPVEERPFDGFDHGLIVYDYKTGRDIEYFKSPEATKNFFGIDPRLVRMHLVDKPRQCKNMSVRSVGNKRRWCPPSIFVSDGSYTDNRSEFVIGEKDGKAVVMYESITKATYLRNCERLRTGRYGDGLLWRKAFKHEYDLWVNV